MLCLYSYKAVWYCCSTRAGSETDDVQVQDWYQHAERSRRATIRPVTAHVPVTVNAAGSESIEAIVRMLQELQATLRQVMEQQQMLQEMQERLEERLIALEQQTQSGPTSSVSESGETPRKKHTVTKDLTVRNHIYNCVARPNT